MPTLLLARHAKSSWDHPSLTDHDRPLNDRGRRAAPLVGAALREGGWIPDLVYSSTSVRTRETWALLGEALGDGPEVEFQQDLYLASPGTMFGAIQSAPPDTSTLMILAHNPGTHALAVGLASTGPTDDLRALRMKFPTGAVAVLEFDQDRWGEIDDQGRLLTFIQPRHLSD
ncbi:MAG: SixA phosphatase family protein [Longimicrobiales bacterium]